MNPFLEKYITLKKQYLEQDGNSSSVAALYDLADELRRNLVQSIVLGTGKNIKKVSAKADEELKSNQQILILTDDFTEMPDMYGWTDENVQTFAKWLNIEVEWEGSGKTVKKQSVRANTALKDIKKMKITLGD